jgi:hypothetical protein
MSDQNDDNSFEDFQPAEFSAGGEEAAPQKASSNNRNFLIAIGVIGAIFVLALIVMAIVAASMLPQRQIAQKTQAAQVLLQNAGTAQAATQFVLAQLQTSAPSSTPIPTNTPVPPTNTPVIALATATEDATQTALPGVGKAETPDPAVQTQMAKTLASGGAEVTLSPDQARTATLGVLLTQVAAGAGGGAPTATALPATGFADEVGLPGLFGLAVGMLVLILVARGLRFSTRS